MNDECPRCSENRARGALFCGACGRRLERTEQDAEMNSYGEPVPGGYNARPEPPQFGFVEQVLIAVCVIVLFVAVFEAITLAVHFSEVSVFLSDIRLYLVVLTPFPYRVLSLVGFALQVYWVIVAATIVLCVVITIQKFVAAFRIESGTPEPGAAENTAAFWICVSVTSMLLVTVLITLLTRASGSEVGVPDFGEDIDQMFGLANAAFWEEIVTRLLYIGVPAALISLIIAKAKPKDSLKCLLGGFGMSKVAVVLIILSSMIFGLAHYPGWGDQLWKVVDAGLMGLLLGYLFVRFGLYASILLHFVNNYLSAFDWMGVGGLLVFVFLLFLVVGAITLVYLIIRLWRSRGSIMTLPAFKNGFATDEGRGQL